MGEQTVIGRITSGHPAALTVAQLQALIHSAAMSINILLGENFGIDLDTALSADGKYCGICEAGTAGAILAFGEVCYLAAADSKWEKAVNTGSGTCAGKLGMCVLAAAEDAATKMLLFGKIRADALFPALSIGDPYY